MGVILFAVALIAAVLILLVRSRQNGTGTGKTPVRKAAPPAADPGFERFQVQDAAQRQRWAQDAARRLIAAAGHPFPNLRFYNMPKWKVSGKKRSTGRKNTVEVRAADETAAKAAGAATRDLMEPVTAELLPFEEKTRSEELALSLPAGTSEDDVWALELSVDAGDVEPMPGAFYDYLTSAGVPASRLSGRGHGMDALLATLNSRERAAIYAYFVDCTMRGEVPGNIQASPRWLVYQSFAELAIKEPKAKSSIDGRSGADYWKPNKQTTAYKFTSDYLTDH